MEAAVKAVVLRNIAEQSGGRDGKGHRGRNQCSGSEKAPVAAAALQLFRDHSRQNGERHRDR